MNSIFLNINSTIVRNMSSYSSMFKSILCLTFLMFAMTVTPFGILAAANYNTVVELDNEGGGVAFETGHFYAPSFHTNYNYPYFVWDGFEKLNPNFWGTGTEPGVVHEDFKTEKYNLTLNSKQMLYSYYRLPYGQLEFRWASFGCKDEEGMVDQLLGFGDPGESFWAGFRLEKSDTDATKYHLKLQVKNFDETYEKVLVLDECPSEKKRYKVRRYKDKILFMIDNQVIFTAANYDMKYGLPDIGLEILLSNRRGTSMSLSLVKYDAYMR